MNCCRGWASNFPTRALAFASGVLREILRHPPLWSRALFGTRPKDEEGWVSWTSRWLDWLHHSHHPNHLLSHSTGGGATWFFVHKLAMATSAGNTSLAAELVGMLRDKLPGSLVHQIGPDGEMPGETERPASAANTGINLDGLFTLGVIADRVCEASPCQPGWSWDYAAPAQDPLWLNYTDTVSTCRHLRTLGRPSSLDDCLVDCLNGTDGCTAVNHRFSGGTLVECALKRCDGPDSWLEERAAESVSVWRTSEQLWMYPNLKVAV